MTEADYVVVGGGTAGSVLAARLSEDSGVRVVLLEAGEADGPEVMAIPGAWPALLGGSADWAFRTVPQEFLNGEPQLCPRGRVLGGTSGINAMIHLRAHRSNYDDWAALGAPGWSYDELLPFFRRSERAKGDSRYRGNNGPMVVAVPEDMHPFEDAIWDASAEVGLPVSTDLNGAVQYGLGRLEQNIVDGRRQSAADAYLRPVTAIRPNLTIVTGAVVQRLIIIGGVCVGAEYVHNGRTERVEAIREVVLCAGAVGSPHMLMLSGIGPADQLVRHGITVQADLRGVGRNLQDHPIARVVQSSAVPVSRGATVHGLLTAMLRVAPQVAAPDIQLFFWDVPNFPRSAPPDGYTIGVAVLRPASRGSVTLASADPSAPPLIDPALLKESADAELLADGLRVAREFTRTVALARWSDKESAPGTEVRDQRDLVAYARQTAHSGMHLAGTCRIGTDENAVVDPLLKVRGIEHLRVADASVMPDLVGANPNATVLAIAERAAALLS